MNPITRMFAVVAWVLLASGPARAAAGPAGSQEIQFADPTVHVENGRYYLSGTRQGRPPGFTLLESANLHDWTPVADSPFILRAGEGAWGTSRFWAPQIFREGAEYLLTYTADEQIAVARAGRLLGPYRPERVSAVDASEPNIDSFLFRDDDGRFYLYHVRFRQGNSLWVGEFDLAAARIKPGTLVRCIDRTEPWEATGSYPSVPIIEGPSVVKLKRKYYLFYSANHYRSIDYAVGYAVADSPRGPWIKPAGNPILHRSIVGENGTGHGDVFVGPGDRLHYVYHVHASPTTVNPRRTRIVPLVLTWNERHEAYDVSVDAGGVIKPVTAGTGRSP